MKRRKNGNYLIIVFALIGVISLMYPLVCTFLSEMNTTRVVIDYEARERAEEQYRRDLLRAEIKTLNNKLESVEPFSFEKSAPSSTKKQQKKYEEGDLEGYIFIPKIDVALPIYKGVSDAILSKGVGHLPKTSLPFGGKGTHCVLTGHSGLSTARLFTDLEKLEVKDVFYIKSNKKYLEYRIVEINVKKENEANDYFQKESDKDYCTLVTCTPIAVNTHRLLVKGERIKYDGRFKPEVLKEKQTAQNYTAVAVASAVMLLLTAVIQISRRRGRK